MLKHYKLTKIVLIIALVSACSINNRFTPEIKHRINSAVNYNGKAFENTAPTDTPSISKVIKIIALMATKNRSESVPVDPIPVKNLTRESLDALSSDKLYVVKLGHSSLLLKVYGEYWLIDPVFSERASPVSFAGPKRFQAPPITIDALPPIERILITHNHYDHLDKSAISKLASRTAQFLVPLGVEAYLKKWGVSAESIVSFEWWEELATTNALIVLTPAQHFSGRNFTDRDKSLWGSWVVKTQRETLFFSGDTGYFNEFKSIGEKYGPFDMTFMEAGAYSSQWPDVHMFPEQAVQAHVDLGGITMLPIHNGTFDLAFHPWEEPLDQLTGIAERRGIQLITPVAGEIIAVDQPPTSSPWWRDIQ